MSIGYRDWKHASGKTGVLEKHKCLSHKDAMMCWSQYKKNCEQGTTISERLDTAHHALVQNNRHYIATVAKVLLLCARQDIVLRGLKVLITETIS